MSNREIRGRAWARFKANYAGMLPAMAILVALIALLAALGAAVPRPDPFIIPVTTLCTILLAPVSQLGAAMFARPVWLGEAPQIRRMFLPLKRMRMVWGAWLAALASYGVTMLANLLRGAGTWAVGAYVPEAYALGAEMILRGIGLLLSVAGYWVFLRLMLYPYQAARNPEQRAGAWLGASWRAMRGRCWRLFGLMVSTGWPVVAVVAVAATALLLANNLNHSKTSNDALSLWMQLTFAVASCLYLGYPQLALAGFAEEALDHLEEIGGWEGGKRTRDAAR